MRLEPTDEERTELARVAAQITERVEGTGAEAILGGSYAKDTWLPETRDIDIFARFDVRSEPELESRTRELAEAFPEAEEVMGSRVYLRLVSSGIDVEIIPIRPLSDTANAMDHSPDHVAYVREHLLHPNEVRALKALLRANRIYGAESHVRGLSGYVCELLIIRYRSLRSLAEHAALWKHGSRIVYHEHEKDFDDPLIVEDPTDPERNAAAAVSEETLEAFIGLMIRVAAGEAFDALLEQSRLEPPYAQIELYSAQEKPDVAAAQLRKMHDRIERELEPFGVETNEWDWEPPVWTSRFRLERYELDPVEERRGPPTTMSAACEAFRTEHPDAVERDGRLVARVDRTETRWEQVVTRIARSPEVSDTRTVMVR